MSAKRPAHPFSVTSIAAAINYYLRDVFSGLILAARRWQLDDGSTLAAAVAYYLALSIFPMWLLLTAGLGMVLKFTRLGKDAESQIFEIVAEHCSPALESQVRALVLQLEDQFLVSGPVGLIAVVLAAIGVFHQFERGFDKIWRIPKPPNQGALATLVRILTRRLVAFVLLGAVGLTIIGILAANVAIGTLRQWMDNFHIPGTVVITLVDASATIVLNAVAFGMLYRWLPKRPILWRNAIRGGLLASLMWEIGRQFLALLLVRMNYSTTYGAAGSLIALLLWFYWGVTILFFGAEYVQVLSRRSDLPLPMFRPPSDPSEAN